MELPVERGAHQKVFLLAAAAQSPGDQQSTSQTLPSGAALAPAFPATCTGDRCVTVLQRGSEAYSLHLQVLPVQSARCQGYKISLGSCIFHVIGLLNYSPAQLRCCPYLLGKSLAGDHVWCMKCLGSPLEKAVAVSVLALQTPGQYEN